MVAGSLAQKLAFMMKNHKSRSSSTKLEEPPRKKGRSSNHDAQDPLAIVVSEDGCTKAEEHNLSKNNRCSSRLRRSANKSVEVNNNTAGTRSKKIKRPSKSHKDEEIESTPRNQESSPQNDAKQKSQIKKKTENSVTKPFLKNNACVSDASVGKKSLRKSSARRSAPKNEEAEACNNTEGKSTGETSVEIKNKVPSQKRRIAKVTSYKESGTSDDSGEDSDYIAPAEAQTAGKSKDGTDLNDSSIEMQQTKRKRAKASKSGEIKKRPIEAKQDKSKLSAKQKVEGTIPVKCSQGKAKSKVSRKGKAPKNSPSKAKGRAPVSDDAEVKNDGTMESLNSGGDAQDSSSDDDSSDWEEVKDLPAELLERKDVKITLDAPKQKKKGFDWLSYSKMLWRRYMKCQHECVHKIELMCLLTHGQLVNGRCNDPLLKALALSAYGKTTLKGKQCTSANVSAVVSTLKEKVKLQAKPLSQPSINCVTLVDNLVQGLHTGVLHRADEFVLLMLSVLRGLGAAARLCVAWYPVPMRITHYQKQQQLAKSPSSDKKSKGKNSSFLFSADKTGDLDRQVWLEVYDVTAQRWLTLDCDGVIVDDIMVIEEKISKPITYIVSYDNAGKLKDMTQKYDSRWMTGTQKLRVGKWWEETTAPYRAKESKKTKQEDEELQNNLERMPFPNTIGGFKDHPLYILERHLLKFEAIYPRTSVPLGYTKTKEVIYSRSCLHTLHAREQWLKEARQVKLGEEPYKFVKPRPTFRDIKNGVKITEATLPLYGLWQTEPYVPPKAKNGKVPRNAYGNVDMFQPQMLPKGCVQIQDNAAGKVARRLNIDCAQAMVGWQNHSGASAPLFDGWIVCKEFEGAVLEALEEYEEEEDKKAQAKVDKRVYGNWKKLIKGLLIRERLRQRYGKDSF